MSQLDDRLMAVAGVTEERDDGAGRPGLVVANELVGHRAQLGARGLGEVPRLGLRRALAEGAFRTRLFALALHGAVESGGIERQPSVLDHVLDEIARQAVGVVQLEGLVAGHNGTGCGRAVQHLLEAGEPIGQHGDESLLLAADDLHHGVAPGLELGIRVTELADQRVDQRVEERLGNAQAFPVAHGAPHDFAQDVAAPLVGRHDAVGDEEGHRAEVIGDDAQRYVGWRHRSAVGHPGARADGGQERREEVRVVVRELALENRGDPFQSHPRIDGGRRQRVQGAAGLPVELHEHVVPDLDVAVAAALHAEAGAAACFRLAREVATAEVVDLRAAAAGPGVAHLPEVVRRPELADAFSGEVLPPDLIGLVIAGHAGFALEDGGEEPVLRQLPLIGKERPGKGERLLLEVVTEREVAEHLEEGVVAQGGPDVVEVVVLAADAHALLGRGGARVVAALLAEKKVLELVHPRVGEQERRVLVRDQRRAGDDAVAVSLKRREE